MLNYSKIIVDTSNIFYRVAAVYLKDLTQSSASRLMDNNTILQLYKAAILGLKNQTMGTVCLLFDPLLSNGKMSERLKIKEGYKTTRDKNSPVNLLRIDTLEKLYSTFVVEAQQRIDVYHDCQFEADDYAEKLTETDKCLLVTSDMDFSRYLESGRVEMLTQGLSIKEDGIFTFEDFEKKHNFKPTISSVTFWKAIYGDVSDNIVGSFQDPTTKVIRPASDEMKKILVELGEQNTPLSDAKTEFFAGVGKFTKLKELLKLSNTNRSYEHLLDLTDENFKVIESMLPRTSDIDINKFKVALEFKTMANTTKKKFSLGGKKSK